MATEGSGQISPGKDFQSCGAMTKKALSWFLSPPSQKLESSNAQPQKMTSVVEYIHKRAGGPLSMLVPNYEDL